MSVLYEIVTCPSCNTNNQVEYFNDLNVERCNQCGASFTFIDGEKLFLAAQDKPAQCTHIINCNSTPCLASKEV